MEPTETKFVKMSGFYHVEICGRYAGKVSRIEDWTVRGKSVRWQAEKMGKVVGNGKTRIEAARLLRKQPT